MHNYISLSVERPLANRFWPLVAHLVNVQNFISIGREVFVRRVPKYRMFSQESKVVHNIVLNAAALARDYDLFILI